MRRIVIGMNETIKQQLRQILTEIKNEVPADFFKDPIFRRVYQFNVDCLTCIIAENCTDDDCERLESELSWLKTFQAINKSGLIDNLEALMKLFRQETPKYVLMIASLMQEHLDFMTNREINTNNNTAVLIRQKIVLLHKLDLMDDEMASVLETSLVPSESESKLARFAAGESYESVYGKKPD